MKTILVACLSFGFLACNQSSSPAPASSASPSSDADAGVAAAPPAPAGSTASAGAPHVTDTFTTSAGPLAVTPIHHASLVLDFAGKHIFIDPWTEGPLDGLPKADYIFITDIHQDHMDPVAIEKVKSAAAVIVGPPAVSEKVTLGVTLKNGDTKDFGAFKVEAIPMYNLTRGPGPGKLFHDKGRGNGYVFTFGDKRVYVSGDTECTPEMKALKSIDVAFLCMNLPYTMPPNEAAECVKAFRPKVVFPYHFRDQDPNAFASMVKDTSEARVRTWY